MWPFSTLKHLRWEIEQADTANEIMRTALTRRDERIAILDKQIQHRDADIRSLREELPVLRQRAVDGVQSNRMLAYKDGEVRALTSQIAGLNSLNKSLAAERDEAVLRARNLDRAIGEARDDSLRRAKLRAAADDQIRDLKHQLATALVRDPKTGRMTKWQEQPPGEAPFDFLGTGHLTAPEGPIVLLGTDDFCGETDDTVNFDRVMAGLHDTVRK